MSNHFLGRRRYRLILPKRQLIKIERGLTGCKLYVRQHGIVEVIDCPIPAHRLDVRLGDLLSFYTELLAEEEEDEHAAAL